MPPKCPSLPSEGEIVHKLVAGLNWALGYVCRPIGPARPQLSHPMPVQF